MKILLVDQEKCTGCRRCEIFCSFYHFRAYSLGRTRLHVVRDNEPQGQEGPVICTQCGLCKLVCPVEGAMIRNKRTGAVLVTSKCDIDKCIRECVAACPYGVIHIDSKSKKAIKCDFCGGKPSCVEACPWQVINYLEAGTLYALNNKRILEVRNKRMED